MSEIREMQLHIVAMMSKVDALLREQKIPYVLLGGSALGAVRHKGFIPWDDDMDIGVFRKDFDRTEDLLSKLTGYVYEKAENHIIPDAPVGHLHLCNEQYSIDNAPTIDVFALDKVPSDKNSQRKLRFIANIHHLCVLRRPPKNRGFLKKCFIACVLFVIPKRMWDKIQKKTLNYIIALNEKDFSCIGNIFGAWTEKEYFDSSVYIERIELDFEGLKLPVSKNYDLYLSQMYGDYMTLPPIEKRVPRHRIF